MKLEGGGGDRQPLSESESPDELPPLSWTRKKAEKGCVEKQNIFVIRNMWMYMWVYALAFHHLSI